MEVFGIRKADDIDFITNKAIPTNGDFNQRSKNELIKLYGVNLDSLNAPDSFFYYFGLKFSTLSTILKSKEQRGEKKDKKDVLLLTEFLLNNKISKNTEFLFLLRKKGMFFKRKIRLFIAQILKKAGMFSILKKLISKE
jgi:hypothetical protein